MCFPASRLIRGVILIRSGKPTGTDEMTRKITYRHWCCAHQRWHCLFCVETISDWPREYLPTLPGGDCRSGIVKMKRRRKKERKEEKKKNPHRPWFDCEPLIICGPRAILNDDQLKILDWVSSSAINYQEGHGVLKLSSADIVLDCTGENNRKAKNGDQL